MIKYNEIQNKYLYKMDDLDKIIKMIESGLYYNMDGCTQESVSEFVSSVKSFLSSLKIEQEEVTLERHETEDEARQYFGEEFIKEFDELLTQLDKQDTIVAIHGTGKNVCPQICENGLQYKLPSLSSTAIQQQMAYGVEDMHYSQYETLLNWPHRNYKGLVILAIPYECFYKEGLWNHFGNTDSSAYGGQDYKIDADFVVGYIDVENKRIVRNPKYNRQHNYENYEKDYEIFREQKGMTNDILKQKLIESERQIKQSHKEYSPLPDTHEEFDISRIPYIIEELLGTFNSIKYGFSKGMNQERYDYLMRELHLNDIENSIPLLKTNEQIKQESNASFPVFSNPSEYVESEWENIDWESDTPTLF